MKSSSLPFSGHALPMLSDPLVSLQHTRDLLDALRDGLSRAHTDDMADIWAELGVLALDAELPHFDRAIQHLTALAAPSQEGTL